MANVFLSSEQQGIVVFWIWKSLAYSIRMIVSFVCIVAGFVVQYYWYSWFPGAILILLGNLLLVVRGYDNRVKFGKYSPESGWERIEHNKFLEVEQLVKKMRKWDRSTIDISNKLGVFTFILVAIVIGIMAVLGFGDEQIRFQILAVDAAILLFPHWITGTRSILTQPGLLLKIKVIKTLLEDQIIQRRLQDHAAEYFMLLKGKETKIPDDVKFRIKIHNQHPDFLGFYGQVVTNKVQDKMFPYFYVVLVAKKGYGLRRAYTGYGPAQKMTKEYKEQGDVEVFVIRQTTTKTSGYHTKDNVVRAIFLEGLNIAEEAAIK